MQGGMHVIAHYYCIFNVEIKILLETIRPPAHYGKGEKSESLESQFGENMASGSF